jgi:hypothetical protein
MTAAKAPVAEVRRAPEAEVQTVPIELRIHVVQRHESGDYVSTSPTNATTDMAPDSLSTPNVARFGLSWMKVFLECDDRFRQFLLVKPSDAMEFDSTLM